ncbi:MAG: GNAT family N-acetyltransferase [Acidimicrobiales bacterium]
MVVTEVEAVDDELLDAFARLTPQLSRSAPAPTEAELAGIVAAPGTHVLVARLEAGGPIVATLTLVVFAIPTGIRAWVEDVVTDAPARGMGVAAALMEAALATAGAAGARTVDLTSRPDREAANRLYQRLGFEARATNVYRRELA